MHPTPEQSAAFHKQIPLIYPRLRDLLVEAGVMGFIALTTPEEAARFRLALTHPGPETPERENRLGQEIATISAAAVTAAIEAVAKTYHPEAVDQ